MENSILILNEELMSSKYIREDIDSVEPSMLQHIFDSSSYSDETAFPQSKVELNKADNNASKDQDMDPCKLHYFLEENVFHEGRTHIDLVIKNSSDAVIKNNDCYTSYNNSIDQINGKETQLECVDQSPRDHKFLIPCKTCAMLKEDNLASPEMHSETAHVLHSKPEPNIRNIAHTHLNSLLIDVHEDLSTDCQDKLIKTNTSNQNSKIIWNRDRENNLTRKDIIISIQNLIKEGKLNQLKGSVNYVMPMGYLYSLNTESQEIPLSTIIEIVGNSNNYFPQLKPNINLNIDYVLLDEYWFEKILQLYGVDSENYIMPVHSYHNSKNVEEKCEEENWNIILRLVQVASPDDLKCIISTTINTCSNEYFYTCKHAKVPSETSSLPFNDSENVTTTNEVETFVSGSNNEIEIIEQQIHVCGRSNIYVQVNNLCTMDEFSRMIKNICSLDENNVFRLWDAHNLEHLKLLPLEDIDSIKELRNLVYQQLVIIEVNSESGWIMDTLMQYKSKYRSSCKKRNSIPRRISRKIQIHWLKLQNIFNIYGERKSHGIGLCGLRNLGNTCFMNASIQCLANIDELSDYFTTNAYRQDINVRNPLGMRGKLAKAYGTLIRKMWSGHAAITPTSMKFVLGQYAPRFGGLRQQDAHELLVFLLDGLHEDLNLVKEKPYIEMKDSNGRDDNIVSKEAWDAYLKRNRSVVVDIFQAQLKSSIVCPECRYISNRFEPYSFCSVDVPQSIIRHISILYIQIDPTQVEFGDRPVKYCVEVTERCLIGEIKKKIADLLKISPSELLLADIIGYTVNRILSDRHSVSDFATKDNLLCFNKYSNPASTIVLCCQTYTEEGLISPFGIPFALLLPTLISGRDLYRIVYNYSKRFSYVKLVDRDNIYHFRILMKDNPFIDSGIELFESDEVVNFSNNQRTLVVDWLDPMVIMNKESMTVVIDKKSVYPARFMMDKPLNIEDCFHLYTETEQLSSFDLWYCPSCKTHREALKKVELWSLPDILVIQIKRFIQTSANRWEKLGMKIDFPIHDLDMSKHLVVPPEKPALYDLIAVINHSGSMNSGHYTAFAKNPILKRWYLFNDSTVRPVANIESIVSEKAYILFYKKKASHNSGLINLKHYFESQNFQSKQESIQ